MVGKDSAICETLRYVIPLDKWLSNGHEKIGANEIKTKIEILLREEAFGLGPLTDRQCRINQGQTLASSNALA